MKFLLFTTALLLLATIANAQSGKEFSGPFPNTPSATEPVHEKDFYSHRRVKHIKYKRPGVTHTAQYEFYKRVEEAAKARQRMLKKLYKPQYSSFIYYGHKRKPKKHSPDKMRLCKECGIRH